MELITDLAQLNRQRAQWQGSIGLVPTMGALHDGHANLVRRSVAENDHTVVSVFVNPTQFAPHEDFENYPRNLVQDEAMLQELGVDAVFAPRAADIYPSPDNQNYLSFHIQHLDQVLCARSRSGHMNGVLQIVSILFHLVQPYRAYFGLKDYQQLLLLRTLVRELHFPLQVIPCTLVREPDGLAMSSRNVNLSPENRVQAGILSQMLAQLKLRRAYWGTIDEALAFGRDMLSSQSPDARLDYLEILRGQDLQPPASLTSPEYPVAFVAAWFGDTRLIDNIPLWEYPGH